MVVILLTHSAQTVLPAEVCADTSTDSLLSMHRIASRWNGSRTKGYSCKAHEMDETKPRTQAARIHVSKSRSTLSCVVPWLLSPPVLSVACIHHLEAVQPVWWSTELSSVILRKKNSLKIKLSYISLPHESNLRQFPPVPPSPGA